MNTKPKEFVISTTGMSKERIDKATKDLAKAIEKSRREPAKFIRVVSDGCNCSCTNSCECRCECTQQG